MRHHVHGSAPRPLHVALLAVIFAASAASLVNGCSASGAKAPTSSSATTASSSGAGGVSSSSTGLGGLSILPDGGGGSGGSGAGVGGGEGGGLACGNQCGTKELCDPAHLGLDDNCNNVVDEGCACNPGQIHWCFEGPPKYHDTPNCYDGTETCTELGNWGSCTGGVFATPTQMCYGNNINLCHAINATPFANVHLETGTGMFSADAVPGSESFNVTCPMGVLPCPGVLPPDDFQPLQSGEYMITYTKSVAGDPNPASCTFPLIEGAPGLRLEHSWEHHTTDMGVDLDLHLHQPVSTAPWATFPAAPQDCSYNNCRFTFFVPPGDTVSPHWFPDINAPPQPVNWDNQTNVGNNTCYNIPLGVGSQWAMLAMGCHNPRLDVDNITCDDTVTDPNNSAFCTPENINVDYPPSNQWFRIGVHYYYNHGQTYDVHPEVKVFYNSQQFADLGPESFNVPPAPVTFQPGDGAGNGTGNRFWIVADVAVVADGCGNSTAVVQPIYSDAANKTPLFTLDDGATAVFAPPWPPPPK